MAKKLALFHFIITIIANFLIDYNENEVNFYVDMTKKALFLNKKLFSYSYGVKTFFFFCKNAYFSLVFFVEMYYYDYGNAQRNFKNPSLARKKR